MACDRPFTFQPGGGEMKLADSWVEHDAGLTRTTNFHDETDGWREVDWEQYVLKKPNTSNKLLHELAREVRGVEKRRGRKFSVRQYRSIFCKRANVSAPFLRRGHDYFVEFLAKLDCVTVPKGETLQAAFERARLRAV